MFGAKATKDRHRRTMACSPGLPVQEPAPETGSVLLGVLGAVLAAGVCAFVAPRPSMRAETGRDLLRKASWMCGVPK